MLSRSRARRMSILLFVAVLFLGTARSAAEEIMVFAAASLTESVREIAAAYEKETATKVAFNFAASSTLALQIQEGARADAFFSADEAKMDALEKKGLLLAGSRKSLLSNSLVIVVHRESKLELRSAAELAAAKLGRIALAEPQTVPAGIYAKTYLEQQDLWSKIIDKVIPTENVRAALAAVESGNVDAGIVYRTDAAIAKNVRIAYEVPVAGGPAISYPVAVLKDSQHLEAAKGWVAYLGSEPALEVFRRYGFLVRELQ